LIPTSKYFSNYFYAIRIEELQKELREKSDVTKEEVLSRLCATIRSDIRDYVEFDGVKPKFKSFDNLTDAQAKAIEGIKETKYGIELKLHGMSWSIDRICKMLGWDAPDKREVMNGMNQVTIFEIPDNGRDNK
jgi:hypothetical protein